jgi:hypothetical protein
MRDVTRPLAVVLVFAVATGAAWGAGVSLTLKGGYFLPTDSVFRDVYKGGLVIGGDLAVPIAGVLHLWAGAEMFSKTGHLTLSEDETKVRIVPIYAGLRCQFGKKKLHSYIGAAAAYFLFHEENLLGKASENGLGFLGQAGVMARIGGPVWLDVFGDYRVCKLTTGGDDPVEAKLDGLSAGLGLVFRF